MTSDSRSLLDIVLTCHNWPHPLVSDHSLTRKTYTPFHLHLTPKRTAQIGFLPDDVLGAIRKDTSDTFVESDDGRIGLNPRLDDFSKRSSALNAVARTWKDAGLFASALDGWRNEQYAVFSHDDEDYRSWKNGLNEYNSPAFELERAACALFGLATFGVHLTAYTTTSTVTASSGSSNTHDSSSSTSLSSTATGAAQQIHLWTPRRAQTKATWPGFLDNSVAGGITSGDRPLESMIRECWEEAGLSDEVVRPRVRQVGVLTYVFRTKEGYLQPEVEYVYDLPLPNDVRPKPIDGEAEDFQLMSIEEVKERMYKGEFKPNCAMVAIDFLIRHGVITAENEARYMEVMAMMHNDLGLPGP
ncbi:unnamed protein product [Jaminaea pallidilutea]